MKFLCLLLLSLLVILSCEERDSNKSKKKYKKEVEQQLEEKNIVDLPSVKIGDQVWMKFNLNVDVYSNGDPIEEVKDNSIWMQTSEGAWAYYNNDPSNGENYGKLYNWYAINDSRGICPNGWRVPNEEDWDELVNFLGGEDIAGGKLKDTSDWQGENVGATNETGFTAVPSGYRLSDGTFLNEGIIATFWTSSEGEGNNAWDRFMISKTAFVGRSQYGFENGFSCRCIKER